MFYKQPNNVEVTSFKKLSLSLLDANVNLYWYFVGSILDLEYQCNAAFTNVSDKLIYLPFSNINGLYTHVLSNKLKIKYFEFDKLKKR